MPEENLLSIELKRQWSFVFEAYDELDPVIAATLPLHCHYCDGELDLIYSYIITCLKEAGMLAPDYEPVCCYCVVLEKYGMLELREDLYGIFYYNNDDILRVQFSYNIYNKGKITRVFSEVRIHDYSKIKWD